MPISLIHRQTLEFLLFDWLKADQYLHHGAKQMHNRASLSALLDRAANLAGDKLASCYRQADEHEPVLENGTVRMTPEIRNALHAMRDQGFFGLTQPFEEGGLGLPVLIERACFALFAAANPAVAAYPQISLACARTIQSWGTPAQITQYAAPVFKGKMFGTMCLAEQQAGSSLGDIETRAIPDGPAAYRLFGHKMWVAGGTHTMAENIVHLVLARVPDSHGSLIPGVRGLSLFLVPALIRQANGEAIAQNDISVTGINRTMGYRGLINCSLSFGEGTHRPGGKAGAIGWLIGPLHRGLAPLLQLMNEARAGTGLFAAAIASAGYQLSLRYARERRQGRAWTEKSAEAPQIPIIRHDDVRRMLLRQKCYSEGALALSLYCARLSDEESTAPDADLRRHATLLRELLTPVAKCWSAQWGLQANHLAIQVFGGVGYTKQCAAEQLFRDNRLNAIQQGTHGVQALELLGKKLRLEDGTALELLGETMHKTLLKAGQHTVLAAHGKHLARAMHLLARVTRQLLTDTQQERAMAQASPYLEAFGHVVVAWIWLDVVLYCEHVGGNTEPHFFAGKMAALDYFYLWELPSAELMLNQLAQAGKNTMHFPDQSF